MYVAQENPKHESYDISRSTCCLKQRCITNTTNITVLVNYYINPLPANHDYCRFSLFN